MAVSFPGAHSARRRASVVLHPADKDDAPRLAGRRILLVEDEALLALEMEIGLAELGAEVVGPVMRLGEGMRLPADELAAIDAAILDVDLRGEDVFPLAERLAAIRVPFLFHTAHGERTALQMRFAGVPVCTKPVRLERLVNVLLGLIAPPHRN